MPTGVAQFFLQKCCMCFSFFVPQTLYRGFVPGPYFRPQTFYTGSPASKTRLRPLIIKIQQLINYTRQPYDAWLGAGVLAA